MSQTSEQIVKTITAWIDRYSTNQLISVDTSLLPFGFPTYESYIRQQRDTPYPLTERIKVRFTTTHFALLGLPNYYGPAILQIADLKKFNPLIAPLLLIATTVRLGDSLKPDQLAYIKYDRYHTFIFPNHIAFEHLRNTLELWETNPICRKLIWQNQTS